MAHWRRANALQKATVHAGISTAQQYLTVRGKKNNTFDPVGHQCSGY